MDMKQILVAFGIVIGTFILIAGAVVGIYFFYPELIGFEAPKIANVKLEDKIVEKKSSDTTIKEEKNEMSGLSYDSLLIVNNTLKDSLSNSEELVKIYNDSLSILVKRMIELSSNDNKMNDSISTIKSRADFAMRQLKELKKSVHESDSIRLSKNDTISSKNLETFAKIYNNTSPKEVAKILENLSDRKDVAKIIKLMQPKKAGKVLEAMNPEIAADILIQGSFSK